MENKFLINLSVKYGLDDQKLSKVVDMCYQLDYHVIDDREFQRAANYICKMNLVDMPPEDLLAEMKRKGFGVARWCPDASDRRELIPCFAAAEFFSWVEILVCFFEDIGEFFEFGHVFFYFVLSEEIKDYVGRELN